MFDVFILMLSFEKPKCGSFTTNYWLSIIRQFTDEIKYEERTIREYKTDFIGTWVEVHWTMSKWIDNVRMKCLIGVGHKNVEDSNMALFFKKKVERIFRNDLLAWCVMYKTDSETEIIR